MSDRDEIFATADRWALRAQNMDGHYAIPKDDLDKIRAAADLLARVRAECKIFPVLNYDDPHSAFWIKGPPDLLRELAEALGSSQNTTLHPGSWNT